MNWRLLRALLLCGGLLACEQQEQGTFSVRFRWQDEPPADRALWVYARVERERRGGGHRATVAEAGATRFSPGVELDFDEVPNGGEFVVVVELKGSDDRDGRALFFGESAPFFIRPGRHVEVDVALALAATPDTTSTVDRALSIVGTVDAGRLLINQSDVVLALRPAGATRAIVANDASFSLGLEEVDLADLERDEELDAYLWEDWDLNGGLSCDDPMAGLCADGPRRVFARFVNEQGFQSQVFSTQTVVLDRTAPTLVGAVVSPNPAGALSEVVVSIAPDEALGAPPILHVEPSDPGFTLGDDGGQRGQSYVFRYAVDDAARDDVEYSFAVDLVDQAGNEARGAPLPDRLVIDRQRPVNVELAELSAQVVASETFTFDLEVGDTLRAAPVVRVGSAIADCRQDANNPARYHCTHQPGASDADGPQAITVELVDEAGNRNTLVVGQVEYDRAGPDVVNPVVTPSLAGAGARVQVRFSFDEPAQDVAISGGVEFAEVRSTPQEFLFEHVVGPDGGEGVFPLTVRATDAVGNTLGDQALGTLTIDVTPPRLTARDVDRSEVLAGEAFRVTFTTDERLAAPARLFVGPEEFSGCERETGGDSEIYDCALSAPSPGDTSAFDGPQRVRTELIDLAGNSTSADIGSLTFDVELPLSTDATLLRVPDYAPATEVGGARTTTYFSPTDPLSGEAVRAVLSIYANKELAADPVLTVALRGEPQTELDFALDSRRGANLRYSYTFSGTEPPGGYDFSLRWRDSAGHEGEAEPLSVELVLATAQPDNSVELGVTAFTRAPWGTRESGGAPAFAVAGRVSDTSESLEVILASAPQQGLGFLLGRATVAPDGSFEAAQLAGGDRIDTYAAVVDRTGNVSDFERIVHGRWVASLAGKRVGSAVENPHTLQTARVMPRSLSPHVPWIEVGGAAVADQDFDADAPQTHLHTEGVMQWQQVFDSVAVPRGRHDHALAFDTARGRAVLFGGADVADIIQAGTWEWDGSQFRNVTPVTASPAARRGAAFEYDSVRGVSLLFGGIIQNGWAMVDDTWQWDGSRWLRVGADAPAPPSRQWAGMAFDSGRARMVLFGGTDEPDPWPRDAEGMSDTWEWDGFAWQEIMPATTTPPGALQARMTYDVARGVTVMIGAGDSTWEWDGVDWHEAPPPEGQAMGETLFYDASLEAVVSFTEDRMWRWDGARWVAIAVDSSPPRVPQPSDELHWDVTYDTVVGRPLRLCGDFASRQCEVYEFADGAWIDVSSPATSPSARRGASTTTDTTRGRVLMFGGQFLDIATFFFESYDHLWSWDGRRWRCLAGSCAADGATGPAAREWAATAYDPDNDIVVVYGGTYDFLSSFLDDTWIWDGSAWTCAAGGCSTVPQPSDTPGPRGYATMRYDEERGRIVMFGGIDPSFTYLADTWEWNHAARQWERVEVASPPDGRYGHAMAIDGQSGRVVAHGGLVDLGPVVELLQWNGVDASWTPLTAAGTTVPSPRYHHALAYHPGRGRLSVFSGLLESGAVSDEYWELDPLQHTWSLVQSSTPGPVARQDAAMAHDPISGSMLVFGGFGEDFLGDTWLGHFNARPGHVASVNALTVGPDNADIAVDAVTVLATAGGESAVDGVERPGAALEVWHPDGWRRVSCNAAAAEAPEEVRWSIHNPAAYTNMQSGRALRFAITPLGGYRDQAPAAVTTDYVELQVDYHLGDAEPVVAPEPGLEGNPSGPCPLQP